MRIVENAYFFYESGLAWVSTAIIMHQVKSVQIRSYFWSVFSCIRTEYGPYLSVFSPNTGKYGPEITPYLNTFHAVLISIWLFFIEMVPLSRPLFIWQIWWKKTLQGLANLFCTRVDDRSDMCCNLFCIVPDYLSIYVYKQMFIKCRLRVLVDVLSQKYKL